MEYRVHGSGGATFTALLVFEDAKGGLCFLVRPDWRSAVQPEDVNYITNLFRDFPERADEQAAALFEQLSSLAVGPLVTQQTGERISDYPPLLDQFSRFVQL